MNDLVWNFVSSSNVEGIAYDDNSQTLFVKFLNTNVYAYKNVPKFEFDNLLIAPSVGSYLNRNIKGNYPYERVE